MMQKSRKASLLVPKFVNWWKDLVLEGREKEAWEALRGVIHGILGNKRDDNYT